MALFGKRKIGQVQIEHEQWKFDNAKLFNFLFFRKLFIVCFSMEYLRQFLIIM